MNKKSQRGFSFLEIMVALALLAVVYSQVSSNFAGSPREQLEESIQKITRAIRFAQNEAILRNTIIRLKINLSGGDTQSYSVDYGPSDTLPLPELQDTSKLTLKEKEKQQKIIEQVERQFNPVPEMEGMELSFPENITIQGVGLSQRNYIQVDDGFSLYFYPTGEKDQAIIFLSSFEEIVSISIESLALSPHINFYLIEEDDVNYIERKIKEYYEAWRNQ